MNLVDLPISQNLVHPIIFSDILDKFAKIYIAKLIIMWLLSHANVVYPQLQYRLYDHMICNELLTWLPRG